MSEMQASPSPAEGVPLTKIVEFLNDNLCVSTYTDASLNGLQVEGSDRVKRIAVSVDAGESVIAAACEAEADMLLVHHGLFWGQPHAVQGPFRRVLELALKNRLSIYCAHLPLDAHPLWGNNVMLAAFLGLYQHQPAFAYHGTLIGLIAENEQAIPLDSIINQLKDLPGALSSLLALANGPHIPRRIGIITGSGCDSLPSCVREGVDTFITGEPRQFAYHFAKEYKLNLVFGGHYATETLGVQELGKVLAQEFGINWQFINEPTGI